MRIILLTLASLAFLAPVDAQQLRYRDVDVNGVARDYLLYLPVAIDAAGSGSLSVPLGANPNLAGLTVYVQAGMPDSGQPAGWAFSNGLAATLCD
ncbi:MAG: hypothetical protein ACYTF3_05370 [Planctomycetota bacterium]|jgi:hypothetical protein